MHFKWRSHAQLLHRFTKMQGIKFPIHSSTANQSKSVAVILSFALILPVAVANAERMYAEDVTTVLAKDVPAFSTLRDMSVMW